MDWNSGSSWKRWKELTRNDRQCVRECVNDSVRFLFFSSPHRRSNSGRNHFILFVSFSSYSYTRCILQVNALLIFFFFCFLCVVITSCSLYALRTLRCVWVHSDFSHSRRIKCRNLFTYLRVSLLNEKKRKKKKKTVKRKTLQWSFGFLK